MKLINFKNTIWVLYLILALFLLLKNSYSYLDPDWGWHLKVGEEILQTKELPNIEHHDFTLEGKEWVDHEWLMNIITFWLYSHFGYGAVNIFFALIIVLILILLSFFTRKYVLDGQTVQKINNTSFSCHSGRSEESIIQEKCAKHLLKIFRFAQDDNLFKRGLTPFRGVKPLAIFEPLAILIPFQLLGLIASFPHWGVRMQEIAALGLLLLLIIIAHYARQRAPGKKTNVLFWLLPLFYLWACLHASFLIGLFILFFWLAIKIAENLLSKINFFHKTLKLDFSGQLNIKDIINFLFFSVAALILTFLTPYGLKLYSFLNEYTNTFYFKHIEEWLPFHYYPIQYLQIVYAALATAVLLVTVTYALKKKRNEDIKLNLWDFCLTALFIFLAFKSRRHFPLLFIVSFPVIIKFIYNFFSLPENIINYKNKALSLFIKIYPPLIITATIALVTINIDFTSLPFYSFCRHYPCFATMVLKTNKEYQNKKFFNSYDWGGYLMWVWPEKKLFIDGRLPQYSFAGHTLLEEYLEFFDKKKVEDKLKKYDIELVLLKDSQEKIKLNWIEKYLFMLNEETFNKNENALRDYLNNSKNWRLIYKDQISLVYEKK